MPSRVGTIRLAPSSSTKSKKTIASRTPDGAFRLNNQSRPMSPALTVEQEDDPYFARVNEEILKANGRVDLYDGDGAESVISALSAQTAKSAASAKSAQSAKTITSYNKNAAREQFLEQQSSEQRRAFLNKKFAAKIEDIQQLEDEVKSIKSMMSRISNKSMEDMWIPGRLFPPPESVSDSEESEYLKREHRQHRHEHEHHSARNQAHSARTHHNHHNHHHQRSKSAASSRFPNNTPQKLYEAFTPNSMFPPIPTNFTPEQQEWYQGFASKCHQLMRSLQATQDQLRATQQQLNLQMNELENEKKDTDEKRRAIYTAYATAKAQLSLQDNFSKELKKLQELRKSAEEEKLQRYGANFWGWPMGNPAAAKESKSSNNNSTKNTSPKEEKKKTESKAKPLRIFDARDEKQMPFVFPYEVCKTWSGFQEALAEAYPSHQWAIDHNKIKLGNKTSNVRILPSHWEKSIEPGLEVSVDFDEVKPVKDVKFKGGAKIKHITDEQLARPVSRGRNPGRGFLTWATEADRRGSRQAAPAEMERYGSTRNQDPFGNMDRVRKAVNELSDEELK